MTKTKRQDICSEIRELLRQVEVCSQSVWESVGEDAQKANEDYLVYARNFLKDIVRPSS